jgi:hypothetical protein
MQGSEQDVFEHRKVREKVIALKNHADAAAQRAAEFERLSFEQDVAALDGLETDQAAQKRGFAAARRPENHRDFFVVKREVDAVENHSVAELLYETARFQNNVIGHFYAFHFFSRALAASDTGQHARK